MVPICLTGGQAQKQQGGCWLAEGDGRPDWGEQLEMAGHLSQLLWLLHPLHNSTVALYRMQVALGKSPRLAARLDGSQSLDPACCTPLAPVTGQ